MSYQSFAEIIEVCQARDKEFWEVILEDDMQERGVTREDSMQQMQDTWDAMLLAAATYDGKEKSKSGLVGGDCLCIANAAAMAMKNLLGLVCDPVAGLVEVPCVKRNVIGTVNALSCADMAMAGIVSRIPPDQVIDAMKEVGDKMDSSPRETALGGLAQSVEGLRIAKLLQADSQA